MGGGKTAEGTAIYKRVNGKYARIAPYKNKRNEISKENETNDGWSTKSTMPKQFEHVTFVYDSKTLDGVFKDSRMGLSYKEYARRRRNEGLTPIPESQYNERRYYVDRVDYFGSVDWDDIEKWRLT